MLVYNHFKENKLEPWMGKHLLETRKSPCEATYQKFHPRIHVLEILLLPSTH
jgi:hypothetical protein